MPRAQDVVLATVTTAGAGNFIGASQQIESIHNGIMFVYTTTLSDAAGTDTLDVFIQTRVDGTNWLDIVHFTQRLGSAADAFWEVTKIVPGASPAFFSSASPALAQATVRHFLGNYFRARWDIAGATPSFSFVVRATDF